jgi:hypothetical protein
MLLLNFMVLFDDAPPDFCAKLSPHDTDITTLGRSIRELRPVYVEQQQPSTNTHCSLPSVLELIADANAAPNLENMWIDWAQYIEVECKGNTYFCYQLDLHFWEV